jgi:hypothetical protein
MYISFYFFLNPKKVEKNLRNKEEKKSLKLKQQLIEHIQSILIISILFRCKTTTHS